MLTKKDESNLVKKVNTLLAEFHIARVLVNEVPEAICSFYEKNASLINGDVKIVRNEVDEGQAAYARNHSEKLLLVFSDKRVATSYFTGTSQNIKLSNALLNRAEKTNLGDL